MSKETYSQNGGCHDGIVAAAAVRRKNTFHNHKTEDVKGRPNTKTSPSRYNQMGATCWTGRGCWGGAGISFRTEDEDEEEEEEEEEGKDTEDEEGEGG